MTMDTAAKRLEVPAHVLEYMRDHMTLTLATASANGVPRATTLLYANDGPSVYVWTRPGTTAARHVEENPVVSFAIDDYASDWRQTRGIQANGEARRLGDPASMDRAVALFREKFPSLSGSADSGSIRLFEIVPTELEFIDRASGGDGAEQSLGLEFHHELVFSVFRDLPRAEAEAVAATLETIQVEAGEEIVRQGEDADRFFIVVDGELEVWTDVEGQKRSLPTLGAGQFFGEVAILRDSRRTATVRATKPTTLLAMTRDAFRHVVAQSLGATDDFDRLIRERLDRSKG